MLQEVLISKNLCGMKKSMLLVGILVFGLGASAQITRATLQATGLTCAMCSNAINKALEKVPFVESVRSDIKNSAFNMVFRNGSTVDIDALKEAVEGAGFSVGSLKITGNFSEQQLSADHHFRVGELNFHFLGTEGKLISGEQTLTILDKDFVTAKEFKKLKSSTRHACYEAGTAGSCCISEGIAEGERVYHVRI